MPKNRTVCCFLAAVMAINLVSCSKDDKEEKSDTTGKTAGSSKVEGVYLDFDAVLDDKSILTKNSADELLESAKNQYKTYQCDKDSGPYAKGYGRIIELEKDGSFKYYFNSAMNEQEFSGSYRVDDGQIKFSYDKYINTLYGVAGAVSWTSESKYLDEPEVHEYKTGDNDENGYGKALEKANETGTYLKYIGPDIFYSNMGGKLP